MPDLICTKVIVSDSNSPFWAHKLFVRYREKLGGGRRRRRRDSEATKPWGKESSQKEREFLHTSR